MDSRYNCISNNAGRNGIIPGGRALRTIIAGSRDFKDYSLLEAEVAKLPFKITTVLSGGARGADSLGEWWALQNKVSLERYPAKWDVYGRGAGYIRNKEMAEKCEALVAFWDGESRGTKHMINEALKLEREVVIIRYDKL